MDHKQNAKDLLRHYLMAASEGLAINDLDNMVEMDELVDSIVEAAVQEAIKRIKEASNG